MSKTKSKHIQVEPKAKKLVPIDDESVTAVEASGQDVLTAYLRLTAPEGLMERFELQDGSCKLYLGLEPNNTIQEIMGVLAVNFCSMQVNVVSPMASTYGILRLTCTIYI